MLAPYAMHTHIDATYADKCGQIMNKLLDLGYEGTFSVEHHSAKNEYDQVEWQLGAIRRQLALVLDKRKVD
jgi:sugar phosphate isomerase/epimerase